MDAYAEQRRDGAMVGGFGDPDLFTRRKARGCLVDSLAENSIIQAASHGHFAIVTGAKEAKADKAKF